jgi:hypothetical protein
MRVRTLTGGVVTLLSFDHRPCVVDALIDLQAMRPHYEIAVEGGFCRINTLVFTGEALNSLNTPTTGNA